MHLSVLLCFLVLFCIKTIIARENFSKFTHVSNNNNLHRETTILPDNVQDKVVKPHLPKQEDLTFLPETTDNGYGLSETTEDIPINNHKYNAEKYYYTDKEYEESVEQDPNLVENGYTTPTSNNYYYYDNRDSKYNNQQHEEDNNDVYNPRNMPYNTRQQQDNNVYGRRYHQRQYGTENSRQYNEEVQQRNYNGNRERQGMSDTRYMENGRYFYDINDDKNNYRYINKGYYGNTNYNQNSYGQENQNMYP